MFIKILKNTIQERNIIVNTISNKKLNPVVTELFIRSRKLNISIIFITKSNFKVPKKLDQTLHTFLLSKFQIKENFNKWE